MKLILSAVTVLAMLGATATNAQNYRQASPLEQAQAYCKMFAEAAASQPGPAGMLGSDTANMPYLGYYYVQCMAAKGFVEQ